MLALILIIGGIYGYLSTKPKFPKPEEKTTTPQESQVRKVGEEKLMYEHTIDLKKLEELSEEEKKAEDTNTDKLPSLSEKKEE